MHKGLFKQARELHDNTGAPIPECREFMMDFERFLHFMSSYFGVKQSKIATSVFLGCRRQARYEQLESLGLSEDDAKAIEALNIDERGYTPRTEKVTAEDLETIFGGADRN